MNLTQLTEKLGDKHYQLGRPLYFSSGGDEQEYVRVHAKSVLKMGVPDIIRQKSSSHSGIAICYGGLIGIDIAAAKNATGVLLLDINPEQKHFWRATIELIKQCPDTASFNQRFTALGYTYSLREGHEAATENHPSFTSDEATYAKVRAWAQSGMLAATDMDVLDTPRHEKLSELLREGNHQVSTVFLTNIPYFYNKDEPRQRHVTFYSAKVATDDYKMIFDNQRLIAPDNARVIYADTAKSNIDFPLKEKPLSATLPALHI